MHELNLKWKLKFVFPITESMNLMKFMGRLLSYLTARSVVEVYVFRPFKSLRLIRVLI